MNDSTLNDLTGHVDRTILPVPTSRSRKRQMREELLGHLLAIYDEELERLGDEHAAASGAKTRFGDIDGLASELQAAVPFLERCISHFGPGKESFMWRWLLILGSVAVFVGLGFVFPAIAHLNNQDHLARSHEYPLGMSVALLVFGLALTLGGLGSAAYGIVSRMRSSTS